MIYIKADTAEQAKLAIVTWLSHQASNHRVRATNAVLVGTRKEQLAIAGAYQEASDFLAKAAIEPITKS